MLMVSDSFKKDRAIGVMQTQGSSWTTDERLESVEVTEKGKIMSISGPKVHAGDFFPESLTCRTQRFTQLFPRSYETN